MATAPKQGVISIIFEAGLLPGVAPGAIVDLAVPQCARFGLTESEARKEISRIVSIVRKWRECFAACGVSPKDIEYIAPAMLSPSFLNKVPPQPV